MDWTDSDSDLGEDEFDVGDTIVIYTRVPHKRGELIEIELGELAGFVPDGVVFRRTHKREAVGDDGDWDFVPLQRSILTFVNWKIVDRIESHAELIDESELGEFARLMGVETVSEILESDE